LPDAECRSSGSRRRLAPRLRLLVGRASSELGYAVPPDTWAAQAILNLNDNRELLTPELPFTVVVA
jgi:hypothetical protein